MGTVSDMAYLVDQLNLSGTLQYFQVQSLARDFDEEQVAAIRLHGVPRALDLPTEMAVITAMRPTHVAAFAGTTGAGNQWIVILERALASPGDRLRYFDDRSERLHTCDGTDTTIYLSEEQLRAIYADAGAGPQTDLIGFTSLLMGLQVEAFGYPLVEVVANMNAECAFLGDEEHDCEGSFFADIGGVWANKFQMINRTTNCRDDTATATADAGTDVSASAIAITGELSGEINLTTPDGSQWTYIPCYGDQFSPGETGWVLTMRGPNALDPQPVSLADMLGDFDAMGLADTTAPELAIIFTEEITESLRNGHVAAKKHANEPTATQRLTQIEAELAEARGAAHTAPSTCMDECCQPQDSAELLLVHPLEGQTEEEFLDDWVDAFREFVAGAKDPDPSSEAAKRRSAQARFGRWRHEQNLWREQESGGDGSGESPRAAVDKVDESEQPR